MIGWNKDVFGLIESCHKALKFFCIIVPVDLQVQSLINAAERIVAIHTEGKTIIVVRFVGDGCTLEGKQAGVHFKAKVISITFRYLYGLIEDKQTGVAARVVIR